MRCMIKKAIYEFRYLISAKIFCAILISFCSIFSISYYQKLIDGISIYLLTDDKNKDIILSILPLIFLYAFFTLGDCLLNYLDEFPDAKLKHELYYFFKTKAVNKISKVQYFLLQDYGPGLLIQTIENGATAGRDIIMGFYLSILFGQVPKMILSLIFLGTYNIRIMAIIAAGYIVVFGITKILMRKMYTVKDSTLYEGELLSNRYVRCLMEIVTFRVNRLYPYELEKINKASGDIVKREVKLRMIHEAFFSLFYLIIIAIKIVVIIFSAIVYEGVTVGSIVAIISLITNIYNPIAQFNVAYVDYGLNKVAFRRYEMILALEEDDMLCEGKTKLHQPFNIQVNNLNYVLGDKLILKNICFEVSSGSSIAFVGESGAGKSTISKILMGLLKYKEGDININGIALKEIGLNEYYKKVTYITQECPIFNASLRENIVFNKSISDNAIINVLVQVGLKDFLNENGGNLDIPLGEKGIKISGGERQRIALARIYFDNSDIVVLDEATSALDYPTEEYVMTNLFKFLEEKLVIIISHRLKMLKDIDMIYVMQAGEIVQKGTFLELLKCEKGFFWSLWAKQENDLTL